MSNLYADIAKRTGGNIYLGVVGPVRTGKSTLIKRLMEELVIPNIGDRYQRERAKDELPLSASGRTIMTAEPKFIPEEAVQITPDGTTVLSVRFIDSVGYLVPGAMGATEDGRPRMVTTPWSDTEIPLSEAAELGTRRVMEDHCTMGLVVTTDGTVTDLPRGDYVESEARSILDMQATGKPFLVIINSTAPRAQAAIQLQEELAATYGVSALALDCQAMDAAAVRSLLTGILTAFPLRQLEIFWPAWVGALEADHPLKAALFSTLQELGGCIHRLSQVEPVIARMTQLEQVTSSRLLRLDPGTGTAACALEFPEGLFYEILGQRTGFTIENDGQLLSLLTRLSEVKRQYDKLATALEEVQATGYGIVMPTAEELHMEVPEIVRKGNAYGVKLRASAPSIHLLRADIQAEISPMVGDEHQSEELVNYLLGEYEGNTERLWQSNIFGKSVFELVNEGLTSKLRRMPDDARLKLKDALTRIINEGANGLICLLV